MKKIFALAVLFAAISLVACGGEQKKAADAQEEAATECCAESTDCQKAEACATECCGECEKAEGECQKGECCGECQKGECKDGECKGDCQKGECKKGECKGDCKKECEKQCCGDEK